MAPIHLLYHPAPLVSPYPMAADGITADRRRPAVNFCFMFQQEKKNKLLFLSLISTVRPEAIEILYSLGPPANERISKALEESYLPLSCLIILISLFPSWG